MQDTRKEYNKRLKIYDSKLQSFKRSSNLISNLRLLIAISGVIGTIWLYYVRQYSMSSIVFFGALVVFIILIVKHEHIHKLKRKVEYLYNINKDSIKRINGKWKEFRETGEEFIDENHFFSYDLDIFGKSSLFQWINTASTYVGKHKLKELLIQPKKNLKDIMQRQEAVKELASKLDWRQRFQAAAMLQKDKIHNPNDLFKWSSEKNYLFRNKWIGLIVKISSILTIASIISAFTFFNIPYFIIIALVIFQVILLVFRYKEMFNILDVIDKYRKDIKAYEEMIKLFEDESFESSYIKLLKEGMTSSLKETAMQQIKKLDKILDMVSFRHTQFYIVFDILTLWDYHCVIALENWKKRYGNYLIEWINCIGEMEALSSLAVIAFEHPKWTMPQIKIMEEREVCATKVGHPLIPEKVRVCNDICFGDKENVLLITGSNMSGKSTFLRTLGINLVLAYAGAPVCAQEFKCCVMEIYTSMRVKDNLEMNISSFYAELLRIKMMIEAASKGQRIFFLLDEIFRGTNSRDRHIGAKTLIKKLSNEDALGFVSTHDLELSELANENSKIKNYHFQEYYKNGQIFFDYHLYSGVSTTFNAIYLMKQAGIEIDEK